MLSHQKHVTQVVTEDGCICRYLLVVLNQQFESEMRSGPGDVPRFSMTTKLKLRDTVSGLVRIASAFGQLAPCISRTKFFEAFPRISNLQQLFPSFPTNKPESFASSTSLPTSLPPSVVL
jgi:hypothetical protein